MKTLVKAIIVENKEIAFGVYEMILMSKILTEGSFPGKFVNIYIEDGQHLLPRPISICQVDKKQQTIRLIYAVVGQGTKKMSQIKKGEKIKVLGPLGNGFSLAKPDDVSIIVGGGMGVFPLLELAKELKGKTRVYLGFKSNPILIEDFKKYADMVYVATEDGSQGYKGNVVELLEKHKPTGNILYSCGPKAMLKSVVEWAKINDINTQISLEERMACGIGACLVCNCKTIDKEALDWQYKRVCKDGPVFCGDEVVWE